MNRFWFFRQVKIRKVGSGNPTFGNRYRLFVCNSLKTDPMT